MWMLFIVLICCFTAWGVAADMTTPMVAGFKRIFDMSTFQASLVQLAYFGAYFLLALPAAFINERFGYKTGTLTGLILAAAGSFAFYPASHIMTYTAFLIALFAIAAGCSILETSADPYVISLGPEASATRRLNFVQSFNPLGTNIGVLLAATLILLRLEDPVNLASLTPEQMHTVRAGVVTRRFRKMGWHGYHISAFSLDDCFVPDSHVLGRPGEGAFRIGEGTSEMQRIQIAPSMLA